MLKVTEAKFWNTCRGLVYKKWTRSTYLREDYIPLFIHKNDYNYRTRKTSNYVILNNRVQRRTQTWSAVKVTMSVAVYLWSFIHKANYSLGLRKFSASATWVSVVTSPHHADVTAEWGELRKLRLQYIARGCIVFLQRFFCRLKVFILFPLQYDKYQRSYINFG